MNFSTELIMFVVACFSAVFMMRLAGRTIIALQVSMIEVRKIKANQSIIDKLSYKKFRHYLPCTATFSTFLVLFLILLTSIFIAVHFIFSLDEKTSIIVLRISSITIAVLGWGEYYHIHYYYYFKQKKAAKEYEKKAFKRYCEEEDVENIEEYIDE